MPFVPVTFSIQQGDEPPLGPDVTPDTPVDVIEEADDGGLLVGWWERDADVVEVVSVQPPETLDNTLGKPANFRNALRGFEDSLEILAIRVTGRTEHGVVGTDDTTEPSMCKYAKVSLKPVENEIAGLAEFAADVRFRTHPPRVDLRAFDQPMRLAHRKLCFGPGSGPLRGTTCRLYSPFSAARTGRTGRCLIGEFPSGTALLRGPIRAKSRRRWGFLARFPRILRFLGRGGARKPLQRRGFVLRSALCRLGSLPGGAGA